MHTCSVPSCDNTHLHDSGNLGGHHRQHLHLNAVELVQAGPGARLSQAAEHLARHLVVHAITAVEHDDIPGQRLAEVLHTLPQRSLLVCVCSCLQHFTA